MNAVARTPLLAALALVAPLALAADATGQVAYRATLDGAQQVPPVSTPAGGWGQLQLNPDDSIRWTLRAWGVGDRAVAHVHLGAPGTSGRILFHLGADGPPWTGRSAQPLTRAQRDQLRDGEFYFDVHVPDHPTGLIRGQIEPIRRFAATLDGGQSTPPNSSTATGTGTFEVLADDTLDYHVETTGLTGNDAHIHQGAPGVSGLVKFFLNGGPTVWSGLTRALAPFEFDDLQSGDYYVNVHTNAFPMGELRGQIFPTAIPFGPSCGGASGFACALSAPGAPMQGRDYSFEITGGAPSGGGTLVVSWSPRATLFDGCALLVGDPVATFPVALDAAGAATVPVVLPALSEDRTAWAQFWGDDPAGGRYASNGLEIPIEVL